jgi:hypothetical protein
MILPRWHRTTRCVRFWEQIGWLGSGIQKVENNLIRSILGSAATKVQNRWMDRGSCKKGQRELGKRFKTNERRLEERRYRGEVREKYKNREIRERDKSR